MNVVNNVSSGQYLESSSKVNTYKLQNEQLDLQNVAKTEFNDTVTISEEALSKLNNEENVTPQGSGRLPPLPPE